MESTSRDGLGGGWIRRRVESTSRDGLGGG